MRKTNLTGITTSLGLGVGDFEARINLKGWASREVRELLGRENMCCLGFKYGRIFKIW